MQSFKGEYLFHLIMYYNVQSHTWGLQLSIVLFGPGRVLESE